MKVEDVIRKTLKEIDSLIRREDFVIDNLNKGRKVIKKNSNYLGINMYDVDRYGALGQRFFRLTKYIRVERRKNQTSYSKPELQILVKFDDRGVVKARPTLYVHMNCEEEGRSKVIGWDDVLEDRINELTDGKFYNPFRS